MVGFFVSLSPTSLPLTSDLNISGTVLGTINNKFDQVALLPITPSASGFLNITVDPPTFPTIITYSADFEMTDKVPQPQ